MSRREIRGGGVHSVSLLVSLVCLTGVLRCLLARTGEFMYGEKKGDHGEITGGWVPIGVE